MTLVEFLAPLVKQKATQRDLVLSALYFQHRYKKLDSLTADQIRKALKAARVPGAKKMNIADVLNKSAPYCDSPASQGRNLLWSLTESGIEHVRSLLALPSSEPEREHDVGTLQALAATVSDPLVRAFIEESIDCLSIGALRASVVLLWSGVVRTLQEQALAQHAKQLTPALLKHYAKARPVTKIEDFAYIPDKYLLLALQELGMIDKSEKRHLSNALDLRNDCGHPTKYDPGVKKVSAHIEDLVGIVFK